MSQLADMAVTLAHSLKEDSRGQAEFLIRLGVKMMETVGYDAGEIRWALERVMSESTEFTHHRLIRREIDRISQEEADGLG